VKLLKEILFFIFCLIMFLSSIVIIAAGSKTLQLSWLGFIPFIFLASFSGNIISENETKIKELESNLKYYKHQLENIKIDEHSTIK